MGCELRAAVGARKGRWPDTCDAPERGGGGMRGMKRNWKTNINKT